MAPVSACELSKEFARLEVSATAREPRNSDEGESEVGSTGYKSSPQNRRGAEVPRL